MYSLINLLTVVIAASTALGKSTIYSNSPSSIFDPIQCTSNVQVASRIPELLSNDNHTRILLRSPPRRPNSRQSKLLNNVTANIKICYAVHSTSHSRQQLSRNTWTDESLPETGLNIADKTPDDSATNPPHSYGASLRKQVKKMEVSQHAKYTCTFCGKVTVRRQSTGIWNCRSCKRTMAGGAYTVAYVYTHASRHADLPTPAIRIQGPNLSPAKERSTDKIFTAHPPPPLCARPSVVCVRLLRFKGDEEFWDVEKIRVDITAFAFRSGVQGTWFCVPALRVDELYVRHIGFDHRGQSVKQ